MLKIENVTKKYKNGALANDNISLTVNDGEIYGFIGPNGAGKSTLIKSIVGLHDFEGTIKLDNLTLKENPIAYKAKLAYIPDNPDLYENVKAINYLNFIADVFKIEQDKRVKTIDYYADLLEIKSSLNMPIKTFSHGMKQKLAIIGAIIHKPKLLVMDEPFVGLDPKSSYDVKEIMRNLVAKGTIIFFSSHVLEVVEKLCDHIGIINSGKIIYDGTFTEYRENKSLEEFFLEKTNNE